MGRKTIRANTPAIKVASRRGEFEYTNTTKPQIDSPDTIVTTVASRLAHGTAFRFATV